MPERKGPEASTGMEVPLDPRWTSGHSSVGVEARRLVQDEPEPSFLGLRRDMPEHAHSILIGAKAQPVRNKVAPIRRYDKKAAVVVLAAPRALGSASIGRFASAIAKRLAPS